MTMRTIHADLTRQNTPSASMAHTVAAPSAEAVSPPSRASNTNTARTKSKYTAKASGGRERDGGTPPGSARPRALGSTALADTDVPYFGLSPSARLASGLRLPISPVSNGEQRALA